MNRVVVNHPSFSPQVGTCVADRKSGSIGFLPLFHFLTRWVGTKKLELQLWDSRRFQRYCEKIDCFNLAELEKARQEQLKREIARRSEINPLRPLPDSSSKI